MSPGSLHSSQLEMSSKKSFFKKSANLGTVVNPFDLVDTPDDQDQDDGMQSLDGQMVVCFRKAAKKDITSKLKAVEELHEMIVDPQNLPQIQSTAFSRLLVKAFAKLSMDPERRVREAAFALLMAICQDQQRRRCLTAVIGDLSFYWIGGLYDPVSAVALLARRSMDASFPGEKMALFINTVSERVRVMVKETIGFRAEEAREAALGDADLRDSADFIYSLYMMRAIGCESFLGRHQCDKDMVDIVMSLLDDPKISMISASLYSFAVSVSIGDDEHVKRLLDFGLTDINHGDLVLDLILSKRYPFLIGDHCCGRLGDFCKAIISTLPRNIIPKVALLTSRVPSAIRHDIIMSCSQANTMDSTKLRSLVEDLLTTTKDDQSLCDKLFTVMIIDRLAPWNNVDVVTLLESLCVAFGGEYVDRKLEAMDCSSSVPILMFKSKRHSSSSVDDVCKYLCNLTIRRRLTAKELHLVLSDQGMSHNDTVLDCLFDSFVDAVNTGQSGQSGNLQQYIGLFNVNRLLVSVNNSDLIIKHVANHGDSTTPWRTVLARADKAHHAQLLQRMISVCDYHDDLLDLIETCDEFVNFHDMVFKATWLESRRFAIYLITNNHGDKVGVDMVRSLPASYQLQYIADHQDHEERLSLFLDSEKLCRTCQTICRSRFGQRRTLFYDVTKADECNHHDELNFSIVMALVNKKCIPPSIAVHVIVYLMWSEDRYGVNVRDSITKLLYIVDEIILVQSSKLYGGYYSHILQIKDVPCDVDDTDCIDHKVVQMRQNLKTTLDSLDMSRMSSSMLLSVLTPYSSRLSVEMITAVLNSADCDINMMALFMASLPDLLIKSNANIHHVLSQFCHDHGLDIASPILAQHCDLFVTDDAVKEAIVRRFFSQSIHDHDHDHDDRIMDICMLIRQVAPFMVDRLYSDHLDAILRMVCDTPTATTTSMYGSKDKAIKRAARHIFNLLHDTILVRMQAMLSSDEIVEYTTKTMPCLVRPQSRDAMELVVGLMEAAGEDVPVISSALQSTVCLDDVLPLLLHDLGWDSDDRPIDLSRHEFTVVDWDNTDKADNNDNGVILSANVLFRGWRVFPVLLRRTITTLSSNTSATMSRHMSAYISPMIIHKEVDKCRRYARMNRQDKLALRTLHSTTTSQLKAEYKVEEGVAVSLTLDIPRDFPMHPVNLTSSDTGNNAVGGKWKAALLSATAIMTSSSHLLTGLLQWRQNMEKWVGGVDPCSICYCVMHATDKTVPSAGCRTCGQKFHSACLYKWFRTSGQATCPLCRSLM